MLQARGRNIRGLKYLLIGAVLLGFVAFILSRIPSVMDVINRLFIDLSGSTYSYTKADYRIYRGFDYFFQLPIINKVFGIGFKSLESFTRLYGISSVFDKSFLFEYLNSVCQALIYYGILGFCLLFHSYARLFRGCNTIGKVLIIVFLALSVSSSIFLDSTMIMYTLIIFSCRKPNNRR